MIGCVRRDSLNVYWIIVFKFKIIEHQHLALKFAVIFDLFIYQSEIYYCLYACFTMRCSLIDISYCHRNIIEHEHLALIEVRQ